MAQAILSISRLSGEISGLYLRAAHPDSDQGVAISRREADGLAEAARALVRAAEELRSALTPRVG
jgi:hypothetical protein